MDNEQTRWQFGDCPMPGQTAMDTDQEEETHTPPDEEPIDPDDYPY